MLPKASQPGRRGKAVPPPPRAAERSGDTALRSRKRPAVESVHVEDVGESSTEGQPSPKRIRTVDGARWQNQSQWGSEPKARSGPARVEEKPEEKVEPKALDPFLNSFFRKPAAGRSPASSISPQPAVTKTVEPSQTGAEEDDSDEDEEWEELGTVEGSQLPVNLPVPAVETAAVVSPAAPTGGFEILVPRNLEQEAKAAALAKKAATRGIRKADRIRRMLAHRMHLLCLLTCGVLRNRWCDDKELQAVTVSIIPDDIYKGLIAGPTASSRSRKGKQTPKKQLPYYLGLLAGWWKGQIEVRDSPDLKLTGSKMLTEKFSEYLEKKMEGDDGYLPGEVSALLFTSACRGLGMKARLVYSLHPIPLSLATKATKLSPKKAEIQRGGRSAPVSDNDSDEVEATVIRPGRFTGRQRREPNATTAMSVPYPLECWCEVYSEQDGDWIPVDPVRGVVNNTAAMEPPVSAPMQLQITYVVAFESGFGVKDVTQRYTSQWGARTMRLRLPPGPEGEDWWKRSLWFFSNSGRSRDDEREDTQLKKAVVQEKMPQSLAGFKDHPIYALERHLKKYEVIHPHGVEHSIGRFKNDHVYPRSLVKELRTPENWIKLGLRIKDGEEPFKHVKANAVTINRRRQIELEKLDEPRGREERGFAGDSSMTALYGEWQTAEYVAPPLVDGVIPKNSFGNIEVFHPRMIPPGCVHLPLPGVNVLARKLGIEHAVAVTGFEFHRGKSTPVKNGVVVDAEFEDVLTAAYEENQQRLREQELKKREKRVYGHWRKLIISLLSKDRLFKEYMKDGEEEVEGVEEEEEKMDIDGGESEADVEFEDNDGMEMDGYENSARPGSGDGGGFMNADEDDDNVGHNFGGGGFFNEDEDYDAAPSMGGGGFIPDDEGGNTAVGANQSDFIAGGFLADDQD